MNDAQTGAETPPEVSSIDFAALAAPFDPREVHWRVGSVSVDEEQGMALAYIDARHVQERLDEVCGPSSWRVSHQRVDNRNVCTLSIRVVHSDGTAEWVSKEDGAGDTDIEGQKGGLSDALKRAGVLWGIGRYLYRLGNTWVRVEGPSKKQKRIVRSEMPRLIALLAGDASPEPLSDALKRAASRHPNAGAPTPQVPAEPASEAKQLVSRCMRLAKQRIHHLGVGRAKSDGDKWEEAKKLCAYLAKLIDKKPEDDWTLVDARKLESQVLMWDPTGGKGENFGDDPPISAEKNKALHALAKEVRPNGDAHTIVHQAAEMLGIKSVSEIPDSRYGDVRREIQALGKQK